MGPELKQLVELIREEGRLTREAIDRLIDVLNDPRICVAHDGRDESKPRLN